MRTPIAKLALLPSIALAMLIALESAPHAQEYLSHEAAYVPRHHAATPLAYDAQGNPNYGLVRSVPSAPMMSSRETALSAAIPIRSFGRNSPPLRFGLARLIVATASGWFPCAGGHRNRSNDRGSQRARRPSGSAPNRACRDAN